MARTVIQIAADPSYLYALCNDEIFAGDRRFMKFRALWI
jgi:hypothetical protein